LGQLLIISGQAQVLFGKPRHFGVEELVKRRPIEAPSYERKFAALSHSTVDHKGAGRRNDQRHPPHELDRDSEIFQSINGLPRPATAAGGGASWI
jgi:hypothetical protein